MRKISFGYEELLRVLRNFNYEEFYDNIETHSFSCGKDIAAKPFALFRFTAVRGQ